MCVCPLHFYDKEKLYGHVGTSEAETKSTYLGTRSINAWTPIQKRYTYLITTGPKTVSLSIDCLFVFLY